MSDPSGRMLALLSLLQTGRRWSGAELAARLEVSARTVRRDVDRLRRLGYPALTTPGPGGSYRLQAGAAMPPLLLDDDEAISIAASLRMTEAQFGDTEPAARARAKLEQVLPARLRRRLLAITEATEAGRGGAVIDPRVLGVLADASVSHSHVRFAYRDRAQETTVRTVEPYRQVFSRSRWYLLAWDLDRADWRTFRLDRITDVATTGSSFLARDLPAESAVDFLDARLRAPRHRAVMVFDASVDQLTDLLVRVDGTLEAIDDRHCRYTAHVDSFEWLAVTTAILGVAFHIEEPEGYRRYCADLAAALQSAARRDRR